MQLLLLFYFRRLLDWLIVLKATILVEKIGVDHSGRIGRCSTFIATLNRDVHLNYTGGTDKLSRNVGNYRSTLRNITEEQISHFHGGGSLKSRTNVLFPCNYGLNQLAFSMDVDCVLCSGRICRFYIQGVS